MTRRLIIEGWRFIPHSYSAGNQFQLLEMLRRGPELEVRHRDVPFFKPSWMPVRGMMESAQEEALSKIPYAPSGEHGDAVFRIAFPYNLSAAPDVVRLVLFGTAELGCVPDIYIAGAKSIAEALA